MAGDPQYTNMPLIATFLKSFSRAYLGSQSSEADANGAASDELPEGVDELIPVDVQKKLREMFVSYFDTAGKTLVKGQLVSR